MDKLNKVLKACIVQAKKGGDINVFDLMYETSLAYPELKNILDKLVLDNELAVIDIKTYKFTGDINRRIEEVKPLEDKQAYLEKRRQELIERMLAEKKAEDEDSDTDEMDDDELRYKALKLCIESGQASVSMLQRSFPIGYIRSCKLVDWMENMGYISSSEGIKPREVLITIDEFNKIFNEPVCEDVLFHDIEEDGEDCSENLEKNERENLIEFLKELLCEGRANKPWEEIPEHPSWDNDNDFMRVCAEKLMEIANSDKRTGRQGALKKATALFESMRKNKPMSEVYECIVFELRNMSSYYYIKIRDGLL